MTIAEALDLSTRRLAGSGLRDPGRDASYLLTFAIGKDRAFLVGHPEYELSASESERFNEFVDRRSFSEPVQYITNKQEFFGLDFFVDPSVLIPRPETELLVEHSLEFLRSRASRRFLELGVGSGCIAVSILRNELAASGFAVDVSEDAIRTASRNAEAHGVDDRLTLERSDLFENVPLELFDLVVSNPPYIASDEHAELNREVRAHEPAIALTDGDNGLTLIEKIIQTTPTYLVTSGILLIEIGWKQSDSVLEMLNESEWPSVDLIPDLHGHLRGLKAVKG